MKRNKKVILIVVIILMVVAALSIIINQRQNDSDTSTRPTNNVDYGGPTKDEQSAGNAKKSEIVESDEAEKNAPATTEADLLISNAAQYEDTVEVRAYAANILEDGGICTAIFTMGETVITSISKSAFQDATSTQCGSLDAPRSLFPSTGQYDVVVSYKSSAYSGSSAKMQLRVY